MRAEEPQLDLGLGELLSVLLRPREECDERFIAALHLYGTGKDEAEAKKNLEALEERVALAAETQAGCDKKRCDDGKCVFDWATVGDPICTGNPDVTTRRLRRRVRGGMTCRRTSLYGCFCVKEV